MADTREQIVLEIPYDDQGARRANADLDALEKKATSAQDRIAQANDQAIRKIAVVDRGQNGIERIVAGAEKKAAAAGASASERIQAERDLLIRRVSGDEQAINRITAAYVKLAQVQKQSEATALLERAQQASQKAETGERAFSAALAKTNAERDREAQSLEKTIRLLERNAALAGATGSQRVALQKSFALEDLGPAAAKDEQAINRISAAYAKLGQAQAQSDKVVRDSIVADLERRVQTPLQRLLTERSQALQKVSGDPAAVAAVTANFGKLIEAEKKAEESAKGLALQDKIRTGLQNPIGAAAGAVQGLASTIGAAGIAGIAAFVGIGIAGKEAFDLVAESGKRAESVINLSERLGTTVSQAEELSAVARIVNVDIGALEGSVRKLSEALADGGASGKAGAEALQAIGVHARDSQGNLKGTYELFGQIADAIEKLPDAEKKVHLEDIFGRGSVTLIPFFRNLRELQGEVKNLGIVLDEDLQRRLAKADDQVDKLGLAWDALKAKFAAKLEPIVIPIVVEITNTLSGKGAVQTAPALAIGGIFGMIKGLVSERPVEPVTIKTSVTQSAGDAAADARRGHLLKQEFEARQTLQNVRDQIDKTEKKLKTAEAALDQLGPNTAASVVQSSIQKVQALRNEDDALKLQLKRLQELPERQKAAKEAALDAQAAELTGISRILAERDKAIKQASTFTEGGKSVQINLARQAPQILAEIETATQAKIRAEQKKTSDEFENLQLKTRALVEENQKATLRAQEELTVASLEGSQAREILSRRDVESERLRLHKETIDRVAAIDAKQIQDQAALEIKQLRDQQAKATDPRDRAAFQDRIDEAQRQADLKSNQIRQSARDANAKADIDLDTERANRDHEYALRRRDYEVETQQFILDTRIQSLGRQREAAIQSLQLEQRDTLSGRLVTVGREFEIESDYLRKVEALELQSIELRHQKELDQVDIVERQSGISHEEALRQKADIDQRYRLEYQKAWQETDDAVASAAIKAQIAQAEAVRDHVKGIFETFKRESEGVFDAMFTKSKNIFEAIGGTLKNALLTALKDAVSSRVAQALTQLVTGQKVALVTDSVGTGPLGKIAAALGIGAKPVVQTPKIDLKTKLDQPNHLGDVLLNGGAVPVFLTNQPQESRSQSRFDPASSVLPKLSTLPFATGGATAALAAALGLGSIAALASPAQAAARPGIVQSTFSAAGETFSNPGQVFGSSSIFGGPGGTSGFAGPVSLGGFAPNQGFGAQVSNVLSGLSGGGFPGVNAPVTTPPFVGNFPGQQGGILGSLKNLFGFKGILSGLGNIGMPSVSSLPIGIGGDTAAQAAGIPGLGGIAPLKTGGFLGNIFGGSHAIGGTLGGALLAGGGILFAHGLQQGGVSGLLQTTAGGAAIGLKFGGPIGALVGGAVGAVAGLFGLGRKSPEEKIVEKVKAIYGLNIDKQFAKTNLLPIIQQAFGGNIDVGVRSQQVREQLDLYAQTTGQSTSGLLAKSTNTVFANQGGKLTQLPTFQNGVPTLQPSSLLSPASAPNAAPAQASPQSASAPTHLVVQSLTLKVGDKSLGDLVDGRNASLIQNSGRLISQANVQGQKADAARRAAAASMLQPNFIT